MNRHFQVHVTLQGPTQNGFFVAHAQGEHPKPNSEAERFILIREESRDETKAISYALSSFAAKIASGR